MELLGKEVSTGDGRLTLGRREREERNFVSEEEERGDVGARRGEGGVKVNSREGAIGFSQTVAPSLAPVRGSYLGVSLSRKE